MEGREIGFILVLIGGIIGVVFSAIFLAIGSGAVYLANQISNLGGVPPGFGFSFVLGLIEGLLVWFLICSILLLFSAFMIRSDDPAKVKRGGILAIIFGVLEAFNVGILPLILGVVGGALAYSWAKEREQLEMRKRLEI